MTCSANDCDRKTTARGMCSRHYNRALRAGEFVPNKRSRPIEERFWEKVDKTGPCWLWTASVSDTGYGSFRISGVTYNAHKLAYEFVKGKVPERLVLDHLCRVRSCVNPDHLEVVTQRVNMRRSQAPTMVTALSGICQRGHSMDDAIVTRRHGVIGGRRCRTCDKNSANERYRAKRGSDYKPNYKLRGPRPQMRKHPIDGPTYKKLESA